MLDGGTDDSAIAAVDLRKRAILEISFGRATQRPDNLICRLALIVSLPDDAANLFNLTGRPILQPRFQQLPLIVANNRQWRRQYCGADLLSGRDKGLKCFFSDQMVKRSRLKLRLLDRGINQVARQHRAVFAHDGGQVALYGLQQRRDFCGLIAGKVASGQAHPQDNLQAFQEWCELCRLS